ncbi:MAG: efflux RND transporter permease subunit [Lachnospiraceae bacterium]
MIKVGQWIARHRIFILLVSILLLIPSVIGMNMTKVNYDLLSYLPEDLETVKGQDILVGDFDMGAFSMVIVQGMDMKDVQKLEEKFEDIDHVKDVLWYDDVMDIDVPIEMLPEEVRNAFFKEDATMMLVLLDDTSSSDAAVNAVKEMRKAANEQCFISGMTSMLEDVQELSEEEVNIYVGIAVLLSFIVLLLTTDSFLVPVLFLLSIGMAILYNLGTNVFLGEISYVTKALAAVLQLGVTMDYSIFLLNSYEEEKRNYPTDRYKAMGYAIANTFKSVTGSSVTTVAGFIALCFMSFTLGMDMGIVMAKGVILGVIACITILPAFVLVFDKPIQKTRHKKIFGDMKKPSAFIVKHYGIWLAAFLVLLIPAVYGNNHTEVYYDLTKSLPEDLPSSVATEKMEDTFGVSTIHMVMSDRNMEAKDKQQMLEDIQNADGVEWAISLNSFVGPAIPDSAIPDEVKSMLESDKYDLTFICSEYKTATPEVNAQIDELNTIIKGYSENAMLIGEAPLTYDLQEVTDTDIRNVNSVSVIIIFIIIMLVFKSISIPAILVAVIEFAIMVNMAIPYYQGVSLPFVASIVVGTIQLGSTVDYAILMTTRYQKERQNGHEKKEAISIAHRTSMPSIITSGLAFFAATYGVALYSNIDMISSICTLLARGAIISMIVVLLVLPAMYMLFDKLICKTTINFLGTKKGA